MRGGRFGRWVAPWDNAASLDTKNDIVTAPLGIAGIKATIGKAAGIVGKN